MNTTVLILGAVEAELGKIRDLYSARAGIHFSSVGIGMLPAAVGTQAAIARARSADAATKLIAVFVGSCGSVATDVPLFSAVVPTKAIVADSAVISGGAFLTSAQRVEYTAAPIEIFQSNLKALTEPVYSTIGITSDTRIGRAYMEATGARFENLELAGVATACEELKVPWTGLSLVTNHVGPSGHLEWEANHREAADRTAVLLGSLLDQLVPKAK